jgi:nitrate reductase NapAB chaperone NapD
MAQVSRVIQADPNTLASELNTLAATEEIQIITKTKSAGKFIVISDDAAPTGQAAVVVAGDPQKLVDELTSLIALPATIYVVASTFSAAHYVVVYK